MTRHVDHVSPKTVLFRVNALRITQLSIKRACKKLIATGKILFRVGSHVAAKANSSKASELNSRELRNRCLMADSLCCMYLIECVFVFYTNVFLGVSLVSQIRKVSPLCLVLPLIVEV